MEPNNKELDEALTRSTNSLKEMLEATRNMARIMYMNALHVCNMEYYNSSAKFLALAIQNDSLAMCNGLDKFIKDYQRLGAEVEQYIAMSESGHAYKEGLFE